MWRIINDENKIENDGELTVQFLNTLYLLKRSDKNCVSAEELFGKVKQISTKKNEN